MGYLWHAAQVGSGRLRPGIAPIPFHIVYCFDLEVKVIFFY